MNTLEEKTKVDNGEILRGLPDDGWQPPVIAEIRDALDRRRKPYQPRSWEAKRIQDHHHEVIRRLLIGQAPKEIAAELDLTTTQILNIKNSPLIQQQLSVLQAVRDTVAVDVSKRIKEIAPKAVDLLEKIIGGEEEGFKGLPMALRARVAMDNLDRSGHPRQTNLKTENLHAFITPADIEAVKQRADERRRLVQTTD